MPTQEVYVLITVPRTRYTGPRNAPHRKSDLLPESTDTETPRSNSRKRSGSPLPAVQKKRVKLEPRSSKAKHKEGSQGTVSAPKSVPTQSERASVSEERIRSDPNADVRGPQLVVCRLCGKEIKLSNRDPYVLSHWNRHVGRCKIGRDTGNVRDVGSKAVPTITSEGMASKIGLSSRPAVRISAGSSPLKLKISFSECPRKPFPGPDDDFGDVTSPPIEGNVILDQSEAQMHSTSPCMQAVTAAVSDVSVHRASSPKKSASIESSKSDTSVMTTPDSHGGLPVVTIASPSFNSSLDEPQDSLLESKVMERGEKWTDGAHTSSPQEMFFAENFEVGGNAAESKTDGCVAESDNACDHGVNAEVTESHENTVTQEHHGKSTARESDVSIASQQAGVENASLSEDAALVSMPLKASIASSPPLEPEPDVSDLEFEYVDWVPPAFSDAFERELRALGICPENVVSHLDNINVELEYDVEYAAGRGIEGVGSMVTA